MSRLLVAQRALTVPGWAKDALWRSAQAVPSLDLRFADNKSLVDAVTGASLITFTRASSGTYVDSAGVLQTAVTDVPRFDHNPTTGESLGLLVEEQRTNLLTYSDDFSNAAWTSLAATLSSNVATAPDGALTADSYTATAVSGEHRIFRASTATVTASSTITFSVFVKASGITRLRLNIYDSPSRVKEIIANVNLSTGTINTPTAAGGYTAVASLIQAYSNSFYRISITGTVDAATTAVLCDLGLQNSAGTGSWTPAGTEALIVWGAQLEAGATPSSYIPTTTAAVTRSADVASITGTAFSGWYRQDEGTMFAQGSTSASASNPILFQVEDGTANERIQIRRIGATNLASSIVSDGGVNQGGPTSAGFNADTIGKVGFSYALNNLQLAFNGALGTADTSATLPTVDRAFIGSASSPVYANGRISRITYWPQALPSRLQALTQ